ncbi:hypothetical protein AVMA1855_06685 [Acidovorax sp. SUPP1855]|uniref:hypothetical protein n=1 Tax=Acidovorax sp. SUPP1855 TaxID=431774 RepID=UPI0023DE6576|nr:hypothetical protein [Acidovorax sp. SUPP1855]GKS83811.1 hypothetical protein AVMA1855_06685 [Acidovorax sp. SUPP1855]
MTSTPSLIDAKGRHFEHHGSVQALTRTGQPGVVLDTLTDAGGPYRTRGICDVLVSVSGGTFDADFVLTADTADALASHLQAAAAKSRQVAHALAKAAPKGKQQ